MYLNLPNKRYLLLLLSETFNVQARQSMNTFRDSMLLRGNVYTTQDEGKVSIHISINTQIHIYIYRDLHRYIYTYSYMLPCVC